MILQGDALEELRKLPDKCCSVCVTSPPYYNARDYGAADQLGTESSPEEYTRKLVEAFREVARVLKDDGTLWLNIGDSYARHIEDGGIWPGANRATRFWIHSQEVEPQEPQPSKKGGTISG